ncbi:hypothetical protein JCM1841_006185 [Sporobolomyces salmonicolor]
MLVREFIDDCLYNPQYGYFSTRVDIFDPDSVRVHTSKGRKGKKGGGGEGAGGVQKRAEGFEFAAFSSTAAFEDEVARRYMAFEGLDGGAGAGGSVGAGPGRQVWHTPTELFKPWYGRALARYLLATYLHNHYPYSDLIIYEIGAGNGTLMVDILDYLAAHAPEVYARTKYRIIEISPRLAGVQRGAAGGRGRGKAGEKEGGLNEGEAGKEKAKRRGHGDKVEIVSKSIFEWDRVVHEPCFFLAMEVLDNFAHDVIRYTTDTHEPLECTIAIDASGDYTELYSPVTDPLIARYLSLRASLPRSSRTSRALNPVLAASPLLRKLYAALPFAPNMTQPEFIPTRQLQLLETLRDKFPHHRVVMSDFESLPDAVEGVNGPVVQTRYQGETVPCTTYLVQPGFFDIFFPTDFAALRDMYHIVMSSPSCLSRDSSSSPSLPPTPSSRLSAGFFSPHTPRTLAAPPSSPGAKAHSGDGVLPGLGASKALQVVSHEEFLERWAETDRTRVADGSNPMVESYGNAKFIL